jgi:uncharacterized membrane protein (DUF2068 family)
MKHQKNNWYKDAIILEKIVKGSILLLLSVASLPILSKETSRFLFYVSHRSQILSNAEFIQTYVSKFINAKPKTHLELSAIFAAWGALDLIEGTGLFLRKRWAEYLTVASTALFIPVEIYTLHRYFTYEKLFILFFNIGVVTYLVYDLRKKEEKSVSE